MPPWWEEETFKTIFKNLNYSKLLSTSVYYNINGINDHSDCIGCWNHQTVVWDLQNTVTFVYVRHKCLILYLQFIALISCPHNLRAFMTLPLHCQMKCTPCSQTKSNKILYHWNNTFKQCPFPCFPNISHFPRLMQTYVQYGIDWYSCMWA